MRANGKQIGVVGLGKSGVAAATFLAQRGVAVLACDERAAPGAMQALGVFAPIIDLHGNGIPEEALAACQEILLSPGVPRSHPGLRKAVQAGVPLINDVEWLYRVTRENRPMFIGITGTNGKSTVTTLVGLMMAATGRPTRTGGNLGQAALSLWDDAVEVYVLELSSFQLESIDRFQADVAVIINLTPDHLDRYPDELAYHEAKLRILTSQGSGGKAVLVVDDPILAEAWQQRFPQAVPVSLFKEVPGGVYLRDGMLIDHLGTAPQPLLATGEIGMEGWHNRINGAVAAATALLAGASRANVVKVLREFPGLPHRMEKVRTLGGVRWYNDSKGTNVGAVMQSLNSFAGGVYLIAGGRDKHGEFAPLAPLVRERCQGVILIGEAAGTLEKVLQGSVPLMRAESMEQAVALAHGQARRGEVVLLSPACASFDMFANFEDRGNQFRQAVNRLAEIRE